MQTKKQLVELVGGGLFKIIVWLSGMAHRVVDEV